MLMQLLIVNNLINQIIYLVWNLINQCSAAILQCEHPPCCWRWAVCCGRCRFWRQGRPHMTSWPLGRPRHTPPGPDSTSCTPGAAIHTIHMIYGEVTRTLREHTILCFRQIWGRNLAPFRMAKSIFYFQFR